MNDKEFLSKAIEKANRYWESRLAGEERIQTPQNERCQIAIVVPVFSEDVERIKKQMESLFKQSVDPSLYEVIYVVNNGVLGDDPKAEEVLLKNQKVIEFIRSTRNMPIFVIDKSTEGHEIPDCNVGKARNRGVAEASARFHEAGKNGIIIQTDADTYFDDPDYLKKILDTMKQSSDVIGIAGGLIYEFDPDTSHPEERAELEKKIERFIMIKRYEVMSRFINKGEIYSPFQNNTFSGANMISKSFESAVIGGLIDASSGEDPRFGRDLVEYGNHNNGRVIGMKDDLKVVTALRDSDRTPSSYKKLFDGIDLSKPSEVKGVKITPELIQELEKKVIEKEGGEELLGNLEKKVQELRIARK